MVRLTQAQVARVRSLMDADERITTRRLVEDAKKKSSPLHALFDWNVQKAAERYWRHRAREIVYSVQIVVTNQTTTLRAPMFVKDPDTKDGYRAVTALRIDPNSAREALIYALETAAGHLRRAYDLAEPLGMQGEIDALVEQVAGVRRSLQTAA